VPIAPEPAFSGSKPARASSCVWNCSNAAFRTLTLTASQTVLILVPSLAVVTGTEEEDIAAGGEDACRAGIACSADSDHEVAADVFKLELDEGKAGDW